MIETLAGLGRTMGFSFAAGINLYATVALLGLASRYGWVALPEQYRVFDNDWIIGIALVMYLVEFIADKIPWVDSIWDGVHTAIRPLGGALIAIGTLGDASPEMKTIVGLLGGTLAAGTHFTKTGTRAAAWGGTTSSSGSPTTAGRPAAAPTSRSRSTGTWSARGGSR